MLFGRVHDSLSLLRYIAVFSVISILYFTGIFSSGYRYAQTNLRKPPRPGPIDWSLPENNRHPIDHLIQSAEKTFKDLRKRETLDLHSAASAYRERRGHHPPPGFATWFKFAKKNKAIFVEEFWDQIYHDIEPLWALPPKQLRSDVRGQPNTTIISVRGGKALFDKEGHFWMPIWNNLIDTLAKYLPDMDIAMNTMDEPRMTVPWEDMDKYVTTVNENKKMREWTEMTVEYTNLHADNSSDATSIELFNWNNTTPYFPQARLACDPSSYARQAEVQTDFSGAPVFDWSRIVAHTYEGYVSNYTLSTSICHQPDLQGLHGALIEPVSTKSTTRLFPLFGSSKLATNNEILLPAAMYWDTKDNRFSTGARFPWFEKNRRIIWRGVGSGGRHKAENWRHFHRHRLVEMLNSTAILRAENGTASPMTWKFPVPAVYETPENITSYLGEWLAANITDVGFTEFKCFPDEPKGCSYTDPWFHDVPGVPLSEQFKNKYLVDVDGNSFSGRYRSFLQSYSLPIKATLFREWHDSRLVAWKHFVPLDNRFGDLYGILRYFIGCLGVGCNNGFESGRDDMAERIARDGSDWAEKVLRREDMQIYTLRLLLEYARVIDDKRDILGWVEDLMVSS